jgi:hypothetical protein
MINLSAKHTNRDLFLVLPSSWKRLLKSMCSSSRVMWSLISEQHQEAGLRYQLLCPIPFVILFLVGCNLFSHLKVVIKKLKQVRDTPNLICVDINGMVNVLTLTSFSLICFFRDDAVTRFSIFENGFHRRTNNQKDHGIAKRKKS